MSKRKRICLLHQRGCWGQRTADKQQLQEAAVKIWLLLFRELFLSGPGIHGGDILSSILRYCFFTNHWSGNKCFSATALNASSQLHSSDIEVCLMFMTFFRYLSSEPHQITKQLTTVANYCFLHAIWFWCSDGHERNFSYWLAWENSQEENECKSELNLHSNHTCQ